MAKNKENKDMLELGKKQRAGQLISSYLRAVGTEMTELADVAVGPDRVEHRIVSKAEALARDMFDKALRHDDEKMRLEYRKIILDRIDGRAGDVSSEDNRNRRGNIPDRISEINKKKLNDIAENK